MKAIVLTASALLTLLPAAASAGGKGCDMSTTPGVVRCLETRTAVAKKALDRAVAELTALLKEKEGDAAAKFASAQSAWKRGRDRNCELSSIDTEGQEKAVTLLGCLLAETMKRLREVEALVEAEKTGANPAFRDAVEGLFEIRADDVSERALAKPNGIAIINGEFAAASRALMESVDVKANRLRVKSLRLIDEGDESVCKDASVYLAELGYYAHKTAKYKKVYVLSDVDPKTRKVLRTRATVQEELGDIPACP